MRTPTLLLLALLLLPPWAGAASPGQLHAPTGFRVNLFADDLPDARSLALGYGGTVFVSTRTKGRIHALRDATGSGKAEKRWTIAEGLDTPNGITLFQGDLYVAERSRILRFRNIEEYLDAPPAPEVVYDKLPSEKHHGWRYLRAGPDGWLYVAIGAPCNVCLKKGYAAIARLRPDGSGFELFAEGIRNSVGFDFEPRTRELWFTDNGRDMLGDDLPPDELNHAPRAGMQFGFPFCHGGDIADPEFGGQRPCGDFTAPVQKLGPHVAALGMRFYTGNQFPADYRGRIFIAEHGSWNRSTKIGYRVSMVRLEGGEAVGYEPFLTGFLDDKGKVHGRPVDLLVMPDGALLVSDDQSGAIYRVSFGGGRKP